MMTSVPRTNLMAECVPAHNGSSSVRALVLSPAYPKTELALTPPVLMDVLVRPMSALGHKRTLKCFRPMSALPPKADMVRHNRDVRFVPEADIAPAYWRKDYVPAPGIKQRIWVLP